MEQALKVSLVGVTGYTGIELLRVLVSHKKVRITSVVSRTDKGKKLSDVIPLTLTESIADLYISEDVDPNTDIVFLCTPHEVSLTLVPSLLRSGFKVIDLSGAYRIRDKRVYEEYYNFMHEYSYLLEKAVYGLPEIFREDIKNAHLVANPGCYPTATLLALYPFVKEGIEIKDILVHAVSGVSGAGRKTRQVFHFPEMFGDAFVYSPLKHRHTPEMEDVIRRLGVSISIRFVPSVIPVSRGMISTVYVKGEVVNDVFELFQSVYEGEKFVKVLREPPHISWVRGTNYALICPLYDSRTGIYTIISAIDNLGKGASLQAVQNMNIMAGFKEDEGIDLKPLIV